MRGKDHKFSYEVLLGKREHLEELVLKAREYLLCLYGKMQFLKAGPLWLQSSMLCFT